MHRQMVFKFRLHSELSLEFANVFLDAVVVRFGSDSVIRRCWPLRFARKTDIVDCPQGAIPVIAFAGRGVTEYGPSGLPLVGFDIAASDHTAAPPNSVINSRRFIVIRLLRRCAREMIPG